MEKRCHKQVTTQEWYLTPLKQGDHVVYVAEDKAYDALVLSFYPDSSADLVYLSNTNIEVASLVPYKEKHEPPYWWIPDMLDTHRWTTPGKEHDHKV